jgi:multisubunit Na+/H+ antiporter MnhB subunit
MNNALVRFVSAAVLGLTWVIIWQQILYAAYLPGEGFTASVLLTLVVMLQVAVLGRQEAMRRLPPRLYFAAMVIGLVLLLTVMAGPLLAGRGLLTVFKVPIGSYSLSSTTVFDTALFFVVSGSLLTALMRLPEPR